MTSTGHTGPPRLDGIPDELRDLWRTRPRRLREQGKIAGVAAGIAYRYDIDPLLVRVAFVVSAIFGGAGVWLYAACWLLFPGPAVRPETDYGPVHGHSAAPYTAGGYAEYSAAQQNYAAQQYYAQHQRYAGSPGQQYGPPGYHYGAYGQQGAYDPRWAYGPQAYAYPQRRRKRGPSRVKNVVLLVILGIVAVSTLPVGEGRGSAGLLGAVLMLGALYLLYRRRPHPPGDPATGSTAGADTAGAGGASGAVGHSGAETAAPGSVAASAAESVGKAGSEDDADDSDTDSAATPPEWDPLGAAPFAWDLPDPPPKADPPAPRPRRSRLTAFTLGLALLAAAVCSAVAAAGAHWLTAPRIGAVALAVVAAGLAVGAFLRTGHGLLVVAAPLAGFVILGSLAGQLDADGGVGQRQYRPTTMAELQPEYHVGAGEILLDLRGLDLTADATVEVKATLGQVEVIVPPEMTVEATCGATVGDSRCLPRDAARPPAQGPVLTLDAGSTIGDVEVRHG